MSKIKDIDYAYCVARIHAVERALLDRGKIMQIAEAKTADEALRMIYDAGYKPEEDYEISFEKALDDAYELVYSMVPDKKFFDILLIENDYYNLKVLLKAEFCGKNLDYLLNNRTSIPVSQIKEAVIKRKANEISKAFSNALKEATASFSEHKNMQLVDMIIDKACYDEMRAFAQMTQNEFLIKLIRIKIDLINILTLMRLRKMGKTYEFAHKAMLDGGSVKIDTLAHAVNETDEELIKSFSQSKYAQIVSLGLSEGMDVLETACTDFIVEYMRSVRHATLGAEPVVAYLFAKENEIKQLRIIMVGKVNSMDSELIKRRLNIVYV